MVQPPLSAILASIIALGLTASATVAEPCSRDTLRQVVDETGARLRVLTAETQPRITASLRLLKEKRGWTGAEGDEKAASLMSDARTAEFDAKATTLLARIDELSETGSAKGPDCPRLTELEAASLELQATIRAKAQHILARLEQETGGGASVPAAPPPSPFAPSRGTAALPPSAQPQGPPPSAPAKPADRPLAPEVTSPPTRRQTDAQPLAPPASPPAKADRAPATGWTTETVERLPPPSEPPRPASPTALPADQRPASDGFSQDEIREASRGFFGTISGGLASVMEHAFSTLGTPTGYVLGNEGAGAFIAGVRYGKGTLFLKAGGRREVYWHGPSIGYDFGASGSKTMFLVYNLRNDIDIFTGYTGVDGSAYLVGGVGMTVLTDGKVVMAPIRSGLGVRLGANIGYIRFTARPTWNPF